MPSGDSASENTRIQAALKSDLSQSHFDHPMKVYCEFLGSDYVGDIGAHVFPHSSGEAQKVVYCQCCCNIASHCLSSLLVHSCSQRVSRFCEGHDPLVSDKGRRRVDLPIFLGVFAWCIMIVMAL